MKPTASCRQHADQITVYAVSTELRFLVFVERCDSLTQLHAPPAPDVGKDRMGLVREEIRVPSLPRPIRVFTDRRVWQDLPDPSTLVLSRGIGRVLEASSHRPGLSAGIAASSLRLVGQIVVRNSA
ncbi:hypothetical protein [Microbacterium sp.]|uniref:hypothetical protein n=1 Tax=Microbacterium sp. TaxID=51671 RepID=UPI003C746587